MSLVAWAVRVVLYVRESTARREGRPRMSLGVGSWELDTHTEWPLPWREALLLRQRQLAQLQRSRLSYFPLSLSFISAKGTTSCYRR